jgi:hypothetical protein
LTTLKATINFQSINAKKHSFWNFLDSSYPDIICGNETWLKPSICNSEILPDESDYEILISGKFMSPPIQMVDFVFLRQMSEMMFDRSLEYSMLLLGGLYADITNGKVHN